MSGVEGRCVLTRREFLVVSPASLLLSRAGLASAQPAPPAAPSAKPWPLRIGPPRADLSRRELGADSFPR